MTPRRVALLAGVVTMGASGWYVAVYLARWEWNRALVAGIIFLAAEVGLLGVLLLDRMALVHRRLDRIEAADRHQARAARHPRPHQPPDPAVLGHLRATRPPTRRPFAWLAGSGRPDQVSVFVPVLLGAGVVLSGVAWLVERIGRATATPGLERKLAHRLDTLALPPGGFLGEDRADPFHPGAGS